jgi:hypothetical protein
MSEINNVIKSAITGKYEIIGDPNNYDCTIGQSFGAPERDMPGYGNVNKLLARFIAEKTNTNVPLILQEEVAESLPNGLKPSLIIKSEPGSYLDSWSVLEQAGLYMKEHDLKRPLLVAQASHVGRVAMQAILQGMDPTTPPNLPTEFDPKSSQIWTRNKELWIPREILTILYFYYFK